MLLDQLMPAYDFRERHATMVDAPPERVIDVIRSLPPTAVPLFTALMSLRNLPVRVLGRRAPGWSSEEPLLDQVLDRGFVLLAEDDREVVLGVIGQFWALGAYSEDSAVRPVTGTRDFLEFDAPGYAKATANFRVEPSGSRTKLTTETRIEATDGAARRRFALYWALIRPGSGLIRRDLLRVVRRRAERG